MTRVQVKNMRKLLPKKLSAWNDLVPGQEYQETVFQKKLKAWNYSVKFKKKKGF